MGDGLSALWPGERTVSRWALAARGRDSPVSSPRVWGLPCGFPRGAFGSPPPPPAFQFSTRAPNVLHRKSRRDRNIGPSTSQGVGCGSLS